MTEHRTSIVLALLLSGTVAHAAVYPLLDIDIKLKPPAQPKALATTCSQSGYQYPDLVNDDAAALKPESCSCQTRKVDASLRDQCLIKTVLPAATSVTVNAIIRPPYAMFSGTNVDGISVTVPSPQAAAGLQARIVAQANAPDLDLSASNFAETAGNPRVKPDDISMLFSLFKAAWASYDATNGPHRRAMHTADARFAYRYLSYSRWIFSQQGWQINDVKDTLIAWLSGQPDILKSALAVDDLNIRWKTEIVDFYDSDAGWLRLRWAYNYLSAKAGWPGRSPCTMRTMIDKQAAETFSDQQNPVAAALAEMRIGPKDLDTLDKLCAAAPPV